MIDLSNVIVLIRGENKTYSIKNIRRLSPYKYSIQFSSNPQWYNYNAENIDIINRIGTLDPSNYVITVDREIQNGATLIEDFDSFVKITFKTGYVISTEKSRVKLIRSSLENERSKEIFDYFKDIAHSVPLRTDTGVSILGKYFDGVKMIREDTVLSSYLSGTLSNPQIDDSAQTEPIFPFGFNASQKQAVHNAVDNRVSIIQGPPGTGKTQTILNLIATMVLSGKTVAVVSNNNAATDNVYEKLQSEKLDFVAARLGRAANKQEFMQNQSTISQEEFVRHKLDDISKNELTDQAKGLSNQIDLVLESISSRALLQTELQEVQAERRHFSDYYNTLKINVSPRFIYNPKSDRLLRLISRIATDNPTDGVFDKAINLLGFGLWPADFYDLDRSDQIAALKSAYYKLEEDELKGQIAKHDEYINDQRYNDLVTEYQDISKRLLWARLADTYSEDPQKTDYTIDSLWKDSADFMKDYPVVLSTTYSLRSSLSTNYVYDYVIIDEASQVDLATLVLALSCARNIVVVGDTKQLPNVIDDNMRRIDSDIFSRYSIPDKYRFSSHSALSGIVAVLGEDIPTQMLHEHYRCHPLIIGFCNKMFYDNQLTVLTPDSDSDQDPFSVWYTQSGNHAREDHTNQRQIDATISEVAPGEKLNLYDDSVGVITPYRNHANALQRALRGTCTMADTVDKFQGRERDTIILNTVDNRISDFASNPNRLNVAVSRARKKLIVVTNGNSNTTNTGIDKLLDYIKYYEFEEEESSTRSVFDYLYKAYYKKKTKRARADSSAAEDLMHDLLEGMQKDGSLQGVDVVMEYPLHELCNTKQLAQELKEYASRSRVDFVLFDTVTKRPIMAIEVDGWKLHYSNTREAYEQQIRDKKKNQILEESDLPLLRLPTTGSGEREKVIQAVKEIRNVN